MLLVHDKKDYGNKIGGAANLFRKFIKSESSDTNADQGILIILTK